MDQQTRDHLTNQIRLSVFAGRTERAEFGEWIIPEMLEGEGVDSEEDVAWAMALLDTLWAERLAESRTWPRPTDIDRLQQAFDALEGFIGYGIEGGAVTQGDVHDDVAEIYQDAGGAGSGYTAYLACHEQDVERALMPEGGLYLMHGAITAKGFAGDEATARRAVEGLTAAGFDVEWDGDPGQRILLKGFKWHKDLPAEMRR